MEVAVKSLSKYHIDALVQEEGGVEWRMTGVYGEQKTEEKGRTWRLFRILNNQRKSMVMPKGFLMKSCLDMRRKGGNLYGVFQEHIRRL